MLFGEYKGSNNLLSALDLDKNKIPRYRDCLIWSDIILLVARIGGNNREEYSSFIEDIKKHKNFITEFDSPHDTTYCYILFKSPLKSIV
jgi:hypothetical protein